MCWDAPVEWSRCRRLLEVGRRRCCDLGLLRRSLGTASRGFRSRLERAILQRFWLSVLDAVRATKAGSSLVGELTPAPDLDGGAIAERLLADLSPLDEPIWLVIDDLHELCSDDAFRQLELLLMRAPAVLRFVLLSRRELHLGLHRLRLEGELTEIRAADLRFSLDESRALFESAGVQLSESGVALLAERTEGWAAGLRLAALSLAGHHDPERFAAAFAGTERTVAEYLVAEVLDRQPERVRRLLLRTSVLERVSGPLADLLTAGSDGQQVLQELEEAGAFVVSLDLRRSWFRYHPLFAELLQLELRRTAADELPALHRAAATWFSEHGHAVEAIRHAQAAEEWTVACRLLSDNWFGLILSGQRTTAHQLLAGFPLSAVAADAELSALRAAYELDRGSPDEAERHLAIATQAAESEALDRRAHLQLVLAIVRLSIASHRGDLQAVVEQAHRLLAPAEAPDVAQLGLGDDLRALALLEFGVAELWTGRFEAAERHLEQALAMAQRIERPFVELGAVAHLAQIAIFDSVLRGAERSKEAIELAQRHGWADDPVTGVAYAIHGIALVVQGRLEEAESWLQHAERTRLPWVSPAGGLMLYVMRGLLEAANGDDAEALKAFRSAERLGELLVQPHVLAARIPGHLVRTLVRLGELERAEEILAEINDAERALPEMRIAGAALRLARDDPEGATRYAGAPARRARLGDASPGLAGPGPSPGSDRPRCARRYRSGRACTGALARPRRARGPAHPVPPLPGRRATGAASAASHLARGADLRDPRPAGRKDTGAATGHDAPAERAAHRERDARAALPADQPVGARDRR